MPLLPWPRHACSLAAANKSPVRPFTRAAHSARRKGLNLPDPNPLLAGAGEPSGKSGSNPVVEAAAGRLAKLGLHLGA